MSMSVRLASVLRADVVAAVSLGKSIDANDPMVGDGGVGFVGARFWDVLVADVGPLKRRCRSSRCHLAAWSISDVRPGCDQHAAATV